MNVSISKNGKECLITVSGKINTTTYMQLLNEIRDEIEGDSEVVFDFNEVEFVSSAGLRTLLSVRQKITTGSMKIVNVSEEVFDIFAATGFNAIFTLEMKETDSLDSINVSFKKFLKNNAAANPDNEIFKDPRGVYTWSDLDECSQIIAADLSRMGVTKGSHVGIFGTNSVNWVFTLFAVQKLGAIACLLNSSYNTAELKKVSLLGDITLLCYGESPTITDEKAFLDEVISAEGSALTESYPIGNNIDFTARKDEYTALAGMFPDAVEADSVAVMIYTSGSTGTPKGVLLSAYNLLSSSLTLAEVIKLNCNDRLCLITPLFHIFGMTAGLFSNLMRGGKIYFPDDIRTATILHIIQNEKCTLFHSVPTMALALMNNKEFTSESVESLRCTILAGAPTTVAQLSAMSEKFKNNHFINAYGMSEIVPISITEYGDSFEHISQTVGQVVNTIHLKIQNLATGEECPLGEQGEIMVEGITAMSGYYKLDPSRQAIDNMGWIHTGDLGFIDKEGYLHLTGRSKELIIRGGENISPNEVANEISKSDKIADVKVVGVPAYFYGEIVCACVVMKDGEIFCEEEMNEFLKDKLAKYKIPSFYMTFEQLPMLSNGKADMVTLKKTAAEYYNKSGKKF